MTREWLLFHKPLLLEYHNNNHDSRIFCSRDARTKFDDNTWTHPMQNMTKVRKNKCKEKMAPTVYTVEGLMFIAKSKPFNQLQVFRWHAFKFHELIMIERFVRVHIGYEKHTGKSGIKISYIHKQRRCCTTTNARFTSPSTSNGTCFLKFIINTLLFMITLVICEAFYWKLLFLWCENMRNCFVQLGFSFSSLRTLVSFLKYSSQMYDTPV